MLTGSHTWLSLQDGGPTAPPPKFDYDLWLRWLDQKGHRFFRLWCWEQSRWLAHQPGDYWFDPNRYERSGTQTGGDGLARFDVTRFNQRYFDRMRERVEAAGRLGIYTAVMLFHGWSIEPKQWYLSPGMNPWHSHPLHRDNNVNGLDGDPAGEDHGLLTHTLAIPEVVEVQRAYVRKVIDTVGDLDNVLYEICNEDAATEANSIWQDDMVDLIHSIEDERGTRHPVLRTVQWPAPASLDSSVPQPGRGDLHRIAGPARDRDGGLSKRPPARGWAEGHHLRHRPPVGHRRRCRLALACPDARDESDLHWTPGKVTSSSTTRSSSLRAMRWASREVWPTASTSAGCAEPRRGLYKVCIGR